MKDRADIEKRYTQYQCLQLPGQPMGAHMGTVYLMSDLHTALVETEAKCDALREVLGTVLHNVSSVTDAHGKQTGEACFVDSFNFIRDVLKGERDET